MSFKKWVSRYFKNKNQIAFKFIFSKYLLIFFFSVLLNQNSTLLYKTSRLQAILLSNCKSSSKQALIFFQNYFKSLIRIKNVKKNLLFINSLSRFDDKFLYFFLNLRFFSQDWRKFRFFLRKRKSFKKNKKTLRAYKKGLLYITFKKKNIFFNISATKDKSLYITTLRRLGFLGRKRREYTSIWSAVRTIRQYIRRYKFQRIAVIYKGWNRFRIAIKNSLKYWDRYRLPLTYVKFVIKIPHNGCRPKKKKRKKRKKLLWLKKKTFN